MNFTSSSAKTLVGSVIAIVSVAPDRLSGTIEYLRAVSAGTSLMIAASISNSLSAIDGTPYCFDSSAVISSSLMNSSLTRLAPEAPAVLALVIEHLLKLFRGDPLFLEQELANTNGHVLNVRSAKCGVTKCRVRECGVRAVRSAKSECGVRSRMRVATVARAAVSDAVALRTSNVAHRHCGPRTSDFGLRVLST